MRQTKGRASKMHAETLKKRETKPGENFGLLMLLRAIREALYDEAGA